MSKMKVKLALDVLSRKVGAEMREKENDATLETQKYIEAAACLWDVFLSKEPLSNSADQRLATLDNVQQYFSDWKLEVERTYRTKAEQASIYSHKDERLIRSGVYLQLHNMNKQFKLL